MKNNQQGFTLIDLLMATAITAVIVTIIASALSQTISISWASHKRMDAIKQVENAMYLINRDVQSAASINTAASGYWLVINLADNSTVSYRIIDPGNNAPVFLQRSYGSSNKSIAQYIATGSGLTVCCYSGGLLDVQITTTLGGLGAASETRRVTMYPRLNLTYHE